MSNEMATSSGKSKGEYHYEVQYYVDIIDPRSGKQYNIHLLIQSDPNYLSDYAQHV